MCSGVKSLGMTITGNSSGLTHIETI